MKRRRPRQLELFEDEPETAQDARGSDETRDEPHEVREAQEGAREARQGALEGGAERWKLEAERL